MLWIQNLKNTSIVFPDIFFWVKLPSKVTSKGSKYRKWWYLPEKWFKLVIFDIIICRQPSKWRLFGIKKGFHCVSGHSSFGKVGKLTTKCGINEVKILKMLVFSLNNGLNGWFFTSPAKMTSFWNLKRLQLCLRTNFIVDKG